MEKSLNIHKHSVKLIHSQPRSVSALPISARRPPSIASPWRARGLQATIIIDGDV
jgi:hypothetical protein